MNHAVTILGLVSLNPRRILLNLVELFTGTSGFSYASWKGSFYPDDLPQKGFLRHYGSQLRAVEINNTFYRMPKADMLAKWAEQVPEAFRFVIKSPRRITHSARLEGAEEPVRYLTEAIATLGSRLGPVLFQLPPNFQRDTDRLAAFLTALPQQTHAAFEFRHDSWHDESTYNVLRNHGAVLVLVDGLNANDPEPAIVATGSWGYFRLRREGYDDATLERWAEKIRAQRWDTAYVFFKHEDAGSGPLMAKRFEQIYAAT